MKRMDGLRQEIKMTPEGRLYRIELLKENRTTVYKSMLQRADEILRLMESAVNHMSVRTQVDHLDSELEEFNNLCQRIKSLHQNDDELQHADELLILEVDEKIFAIKTRALTWMRDLDQRMKNASSSPKKSKVSSKSKSKSSNSSKSSKSSKSFRSTSSKSAKDKYLEEAAKMAALKAEANFISNMASLKTQREIAKSEAKMKVYEQFIEPTDTGITRTNEKTGVTPINENALITTHNHVTNQNSEEHQVKSSTNLSSTISSLLKMQSAPEPTIDIFYGNPLDFKYFLKTFEEVVETKIEDCRGRLIRLIQFTSGEAKDLIQGCIHLESDLGYQQAKQLLTKRFGDPYRILSAYRNKLHEMKPIKHADSLSLRQLYTFLTKSSHVVTDYFDTPENICIVISKLPGNLRDRWNRNVYQIRKNNHREPIFKDLIDFVDKETTLADDPLFSKEAINGNPSCNILEDKKPSKVRTYTSRFQPCIYCNKTHDIDKCFAFKNLELKERGKWLLKNRYCFGCLNKGHIVRNCDKIRICAVCKAKHPTLLHGYHTKRENSPGTESSPGTTKSKDPVSADNTSTEKRENKNNGSILNCAINEFKNDYVSMCIVPVHVRLHENYVTTYALLDNCSQGTFIDEELLSNLGSNFTETELSVKTLTGHEISKSKVVNGLQVCGTTPNDQWIKLPKTYSKTDMLMDDHQIPNTKDVIQKWPHLEQLREYVHQVGDLPKMKVGILIGANCPKAIQPIQVIPSSNEGPYAFRTKLGWCIVGPLFHRNLSSYTSCRHVFVHQTQLRDNSIERMIKSVYDGEQTINSKSLGEEFSQHDVKFLKTMDDQCQMVSGHYVLPLPFRNESVNLPNNRELALKRLYYLKRKFARDPTFHRDYKNFLDNVFSKGYARKVQDTYKDNEQWFIPHHGVYHQRKKKLRVVFDCSSVFQGKSLNGELLQGPDLTNQLVGVLTRFRQHDIATMGDIESMFYQVQIPESQRRYVQFLWWEDGDTRNKIQEYEMCVHIA